MLGLSGGVITVPSLVLIFHLTGYPQSILMHTAIGTSLAAMVLNGMASTYAHHRRSSVMWDIVFVMIPGLILGCLLGAFFAHFLSGIVLQIIFGVFIALLGAHVLFSKSKKKGTEKPDKSLYTWIGIGIGFLSSLLGIGGGVFMVPLLLAFNHPEKKAVGTSAAMGLLITTLAALGYLYFGLQQSTPPTSLGYIYLPAFILIGLTTIFFAPLGAKFAHQIEGNKLRKIFASILILIGILMIFN